MVTITNHPTKESHVMCTSLAIKTEDFYFGRTMDLDYELNSAVIFTPRNYPFILRKTAQLTNHYAILGMGMEVDGYPTMHTIPKSKHPTKSILRLLSSSRGYWDSAPILQKFGCCCQAHT